MAALEHSMRTKGRNYAVISPAKDEEKNIERTVKSILLQTIQPAIWIVVDDGSQDRTAAIVSGYSQTFPWIKVLSLDHRSPRAPGPGVVRAFNEGFRLIQDGAFDFVVKLDCDLDLPPDYFEQMLGKFTEDRALGIASGVYLEDHGDGWSVVKMPSYHAAGALKMIRTECFKDVGGFLTVRGWDTIDETRAQMLGWKTCHFPEIQVRHLRPEGSAIGFLRTSIESGEGHYRMGGGVVFFTLKAAHRAVRGRPFLVGAAAMTFGYLSAWISRKELLVSDAEARHYRRQLNRRIIDRAFRLFCLTRETGKVSGSTHLGVDRRAVEGPSKVGLSESRER